MKSKNYTDIFNNSIFWIFLGFVIHLISAHFSIGFDNLDEHFQIISPLENLLGINDKLNIEIWEFFDSARIRPWFQSYIFFYIVKFCYLLGINDPFKWTFAIRIFCILIGYISVIFFYQSVKKDLYIENTFSKIFIFLFWFFPIIHSRTSSENLGISFFIIGLSFYFILLKIKNNNPKYLFYSLLIGLAFGLSMIVRYHLVFLIAPIFIWICFFRFNLKDILTLIFIGCVILLVLAVGLIFDFYGYGEFNFTYYNYFKLNFLLGGFNYFEHERGWYYLYEMLISFSPPLSLFIIIASVYFWIKKPKHILTFITIPSLIILSLLDHKELRFIYPALFFSPFFVCFWINKISLYNLKSYIQKFILFINCIFLILIFIPANEQVRLYKFIYYNYQIDEQLFYYKKNPYLIDDLNPKLYTHFLPPIEKLTDQTKLHKSWIIIRDNAKYEKMIKKENCYKKFSIYPEIINLNPNWKKREFNWYVVYCK